MNKQGAYIQALGGHLVDLWRLITFTFEVPYSYTKFRNINAVRKKTAARIMLETGTYLGVTADRCARVFDKVYTIELDKDLAAQAARWLKRRSNVEVVQGDALHMLPVVLARPEVTDVLIFLDGHFSGGNTALGQHTEPAVLEVEALAPHKHKIRAIVVDDFHWFGYAHGWPKKHELLQSLERTFGDDFIIHVHVDQVVVTRK